MLKIEFVGEWEVHRKWIFKLNSSLLNLCNWWCKVFLPWVEIGGSLLRLFFVGLMNLYYCICHHCRQIRKWVDDPVCIFFLTRYLINFHIKTFVKLQLVSTTLSFTFFLFANFSQFMTYGTMVQKDEDILLCNGLRYVVIKF